MDEEELISGGNYFDAGKRRKLFHCNDCINDPIDAYKASLSLAQPSFSNSLFAWVLGGRVEGL